MTRSAPRSRPAIPSWRPPAPATTWARCFPPEQLNGWFGGRRPLLHRRENTPRLTGTGTEDYFNDAWGFREFCHPYAGCPIFEGRSIDSASPPIADIPIHPFTTSLPPP
ncbi:DUF2961 domain-containing protein [bacterium]|nr:DUF2961 domain-containing protein [bacterium]